MTSRTGRTGRSNRSGKGSKRAGGKAGGVAKGIKDFIDDFDTHDGKMPGTETLIPLPLGLGEIVISPDEGPVDPWDCKRWPKSIFCDGDFKPDPKGTGIGIEGISMSECELIIEIGYELFGFSMPTGLIGWSSGKCEEVPEPPPDPGPGPNLDEPGFIGPGGNYEDIRFNCSFCNVVVWYGYNDTAVRHRTWLADVLRIQGTVAGNLSVPAWVRGTTGANQTCFALPYEEIVRGENGNPLYNPNGTIATRRNPYELGRKGRIEFFYHAYSGMEAPRSLIAFITVDEEVARAGYSPANVIQWIKEASPRKRFIAYGGGALESNDYFYGSDWENSEIIAKHQTWWSLFNTNSSNCVWPASGGGGGPFPQPRIMKKDCCDASKAALRKLKRIEAVLQPDKFLKFSQDGTPTTTIGKIPKRLTTPGGEGYEKLAGYSDTAGALVKMLDRISGFWPATVEVKNLDAGEEVQEPTMQIHSISDGFKQALEALAHLVTHSASDSGPAPSEPEEDPSLKILAAILTEVGLTHKIAAITNQTTNNIEEFLDYKVRQEEEFLPMAFNPLVERTWANLEYTKPSNAQMDQYIKNLLTPSIQDIIVTKIEENKLFTEWMLEILKHSSAASAALTQQIKSKEDLKKALGTARFNALVQGALNMEQIRRVLGLPSNWDLNDFAENLEDNFHPDENVEPGLHGETKPKQAKEKPRIKDISKNGRRRKR
ncbi:hypothetical protein [Oscillatoria acuminata]|uniref:Uncharacterized protein n=1 Tax=Oscillatoria acuminata PCC 6304 TaxID=56110 RepID=K9TDG3_9CYAN|nr:hypothetical protein [Oscillatoria acuminata]AFY80171.1 hypothetical protein Oscil6304_0422 [Oscillatoria acuminata PCC 6304]